MNSLSAPTALPGVPAMPQAQAGPGRAAGDEAFSRCLDRAVERDAAPRAAPPDRETETAHACGDDSRADTGQTALEDDTTPRDDEARPGQDAAHGARARGARRPGASDARGDAARAARDGAVQSAAALAAGLATTDASAGSEAGASVEAAAAEPRSIDTLLPGWPTLAREQAAAVMPAAPDGAATSAATTPLAVGGGWALADAASEADPRSAIQVANPSTPQSALQSAAQAATQSADAAQAAQTAQANKAAEAVTAPDPAALPSRFADALQAAAEVGTKGQAGANRTSPDLPSLPPLPAWAAAQTASPVSAASDPTRVAQSQVSAPVDSPAFAPALATQVRWLVREGMQEARLSLNPAEMGPVTVQIVIDGRDARIDLRADVAATRQALEASLPVLAAALDDSGLRLAGGGVHDGASARQGQPGAGFDTPRRSVAQGEPATAAVPPAPLRGGGRERGLVDLVA